jgi:hypothetical protein
VAVTTQLPPLVALKVEPLTEQPEADPLVAAYVTAPAPEPPLVVSAIVEPTRPERDVSVKAAWVAGAKVTTVAGEFDATCVASAALVAVTRHVPALVARKIAPLTAHPEADPFAAT